MSQQNSDTIVAHLEKMAKLSALPDVLRAKLSAIPIIKKERSVALTTDEKTVIAQFGKVSAEAFAATKANGGFLTGAPRGDDPDDKDDLVQRAKNHLSMAGERDDEMSEDQRLDAAADCLKRAAAKARGNKVHSVLSVGNRPMVRFAQ
jgi:hypothetical protein